MSWAAVASSKKNAPKTLNSTSTTPKKQPPSISGAPSKSPAKANPKIWSAPVAGPSNVAKMPSNSVSSKVTSSITPNWSQLPSDVLEHHVQPSLMHPSSIKVMRLVCKHYSQCLKLPSVRFHFKEGNEEFLKEEPFRPALLSCLAAHITFESYEKIEEVMSLLKQNIKLRSLKLYFVPFESLRTVAAYIESPHDALHTLYIVGHYSTENQTNILADALQKQQSIKELYINNFVHHGDEDERLMRCIMQKNIQKLYWRDNSMSLESIKLLASWIASPTCSLVEFSTRAMFGEKETSILLDSFKLNRSLRTLTLPKLECESEKIFDSIAQQGLIENLNLSQGYISTLTSLLKMLMSCKRLEPDEINFGVSAFTSATRQDYELMCRYIASPNCFADSINLRPFLCVHRVGDEKMITDAWRKNSTLLSLRLDFQSLDVTDEVANVILECSDSLKQLVVERIDKCQSENQTPFLKALQSSKQLEVLQLGQNASFCEGERSWMARFFSGVESLKRLKEFRIWRHSIASVGRSISKTISSLAFLRILDLKGCLISEQVLADILRAASNLRKLEELRMNKIQFTEDSDDDTGFDSALKAVMKNNPLQVLSMNNVEWFYSTLDMIHNFLSTSTTISIHLIDLTGCNVDPELKEMFAALVKSKSGLISINC